MPKDANTRFKKKSSKTRENEFNLFFLASFFFGHHSSAARTALALSGWHWMLRAYRR